MRHPEETLEQIRHCLYSEIQIPIDSEKLDYRCQADVPHSRPNELGPTCRLMHMQPCKRYETFPDCKNT